MEAQEAEIPYAVIEFTPEDVEYIVQIIDRIAEILENDGEAIRQLLNVAPTVEISLEELNLDALAQSMFGITNPIGQIQKWFQDRLTELTSWFSSAVDSIFRTIYDTLIKPTLSAIEGGVSFIRSILAQIPNTIIGGIKGFIDWLWSGIQSLFTTVSQGLANLGSALSAGIASIINAVSGIASALAQVPNMVINGVKGFIDWLWSGIQSIGTTLMNALGAVQSALSGVGQAITQGIAGFIEALKSNVEWLAGYILGALDSAVKGLSGVLETLRQAWEQSMQTVSNWMQYASAAIQGFVNALLNLPQQIGQYITGIINAITALGEALLNFFRDPIGTLKAALEWLAQQLWNLLPDWLKNAISGIQQAIDALVKGFQEFLKDPLGFIQKGFSWLAEQLWNLLPDWLKGAITAIQDFFKWLWEQIQGFFRDPWGAISKAFEELGKWIWERLPEPLKWLIENIQKALAAAWDTVVTFFTKTLPDFFKWLWEGLQEFAKDPFAWLQKNILKPIQRGLEWIWQQLLGLGEWLLKGLQAIWDAVARGLTWLANALGQAIASIGAALLNVGQAVANALSGIPSWIAEQVKNTLTAVMKPIVGAFKDAFSKVSKGEAEGLELAAGVVATAFIAFLPLMFLSDVLKGVGKSLDTLGQWITARFAPLGMGGTATVQFTLKIGEVLSALAERVKFVPDEFLKAMITAFTFAAMWTVHHAIGYAWRNILWDAGADLIWTLPSTEKMIDFVQRAMPAALGFTVTLPKSEKLNITYDFETLLDYTKMYATMGGLPLTFIDVAFATVDKFHITVTDRFGMPRKIPLSLLYELPSASDIATMAVRDVFKRYEDFAAVFAARGMVPDVAALYMLLRFRYPPPERLAEFYWRGIAGMLWSTGLPKDPEMLTDLQKKLKVGKLGAPPAKLNFNADVLNQMIATYMKWHDLFPLAWEEGFPADVDIIHDLMADMPGRIDLRWMQRWGLFEQLAKLRFGITSPITALADTLKKATGKELFSPKVEAGISMDVTLLARFAEATGMHPYWVPLVAVAEAINALADEKTLVRSGFINIYREGLATLDATEQLMSGIIVTTFTTGYIDPNTGNAVTFDYKVPLAWLPAERRMLQLRAAVDRVVDLFREGYREIVRGVRELIMTPEQALELWKQIATTLNDYLKTQVKAIAGVDVPFMLDEEYADQWLGVAKLTAQVELAVRKRILAQRILGWVLYRVAYGYVTQQELATLVQVLQSKFALTSDEAEAVFELAKAIVGIARREEQYRAEYIPTPSTLASMMEYITVPQDLVLQAFSERGIIEPWATLWMKYIAARSIASETNTMVSTFRRIAEYFVVPAEVAKQVEELMKQGGWTEPELRVFEIDMTLRKIYRTLSTLIPTLRQFVGDAMYIGEWEKLLDDMLKARGIDVEKYKQQVEYYRKLIKSRKLWRRVSMYITELVNCAANGIIDEATLRKELEPLKQYGLDDLEIELIVKTARYRAQRYAVIYGRS